MSTLIYNKTPFELTVDRRADGTETRTNLLPGHRWYVEETAAGDQLTVRLFIDPTHVVRQITVSEGQTQVDIVNSDLRSHVDSSAPDGSLGIPENILCDLYTVGDDGRWTLERGNAGINPNAGSFVGVRPGQLFVGVAPGQSVSQRDTVKPLFWVYAYDPGSNDPYSDEIAYNAHVQRNYLRGNVSSDGNHIFEDPEVTRERLLPSGKPRLFQGEALVYQSRNYDQGADASQNYFWIFNNDLPDLGLFAPPIDQGNGHFSTPSLTGRSVIPGPSTDVTCFSAINYGGTGSENNLPQNDVAIQSLRIRQVVAGGRADLRMMVDLSEDLDANGHSATFARTTFALGRFHSVGGRAQWPRVRFQSQRATTAEIDDNTSPTSLSPASWSSYFTPNALGRVKVCQAPQNQLHFPALFAQTETMGENQVVAFHPDIALHRRLQEKLGSGDSSHDFKSNRQALGISTDRNRLPDQACDDVQKAVVYLSKVAMTSLCQDSNAVHATQRLNGLAMPDKHWILARTSSGGPAYTAYSASAFQRQIDAIDRAVPGGIQDADPHYARGFWSWIHSAWNHIKHIAISVIHAVEHTVEAVVHYVEAGIEKAVRFVIKSAVHLGHLIVTVLKAIELAVEKLIDFIKFVIAAIETIGPTYRALKQALTARIQSWKHFIDHELSTAAINSELDKIRNHVLTEIGEPQMAVHSRASHPHQSALEKMEWLLGKILSFFASGGGAMAGHPGGPLTSLSGDILHTLISTVTHAEHTLADAVAHPDQMGPALRRLSGTVVSDVLDGVEHVADDLVDFVRDEAEVLDRMITGQHTWNIPLVSDLYRLLTGDPLTPLNLTCLLYAVPTGIAFHARGIDPHHLRLDAGTLAEADNILGAVGDYFNGLTAPLTTMALSGSTIPRPMALLIATSKAATTVAGAVVGVVHPGQMAVKALKVVIAVRAAFGLVISALGVTGALQVNAVLDIVLGGIKIALGGANASLPGKTRTVLAAEGGGWFLECGGFVAEATAQPEVAAGFAVVEDILFGGALVTRFAWRH